VVCLHGIGMSGAGFVPLLDALASRHGRAGWALDLPGHGRSKGPPRPLGLAGLADAVLNWLRIRGFGPVCLLGDSFGCQVAIRAALSDPGAVSSLVLLGPTCDPSARTYREQIARWLRNARVEHVGTVPGEVAACARGGPWTTAAALRASFADEVETSLSRLRVPTLVVRGGRDVIVTPHWAQRVTDLVPGARLVTMPDAAHRIASTRPRELADTVEAFASEATPT